MAFSEQTTCKSTLRAWGHAARRSFPDKDCASREIMTRLRRLSEFAKAETILFYVDARHEVRTRPALGQTLGSGKRVGVPWCHADGELKLFHLTEMAELLEGRHRILEPRAELRKSAERRVEPEELDLVLVPGVAFDVAGARLGHGLGYYDKLLARVRSDCSLVGLAYECQIAAEKISVEKHDVSMDLVVTEKRVIRCPRT